MSDCEWNEELNVVASDLDEDKNEEEKPEHNASCASMARVRLLELKLDPVGVQIRDVELLSEVYCR